MKTKRSQEGYLMIDHRNSPGVRTDKVVTAGKGELYESATITCSHCCAVVALNPNRTRERAWCTKCDHYICDACAVAGDCMPFTKVTDLTLERAIRGLDSYVNPLLKGI